MLHTPELGISKEELKQLNDAYVEFCRYHDVPLIDPKRMSELNLIGAVVMIYGTRAWTIVRKKKQNGPQKVVAMPQQRAN